MKNILSLGLIALSLSANAQINPALNKVTTMSRSGDTVVNSGTDYVQSQVQSWAKTVSIQAIISNISGTVSATGLLQGSLDGTNFINIGTDTLKATNQTTNSKLWVINGSPYEYYRVTFLGSGTDSFRIKGYILPNNLGVNYTSVSNMKAPGDGTKDTITNTDTNYVTSQVKGWFERISIQAVVTKISGTAAGTVTLQGSNDGVNYSTVNTGFIETVLATAPYTTGGVATKTVTNVTTTTSIFTVIGSPYEYYRLSYTGSGTMVCSLKGYILANR